MADEEQSRLSARARWPPSMPPVSPSILRSSPRAPIYLLGSAQAHGALLALAERGMTVEVWRARILPPCSGWRPRRCWVCREPTFCCCSIFAAWRGSCLEMTGVSGERRFRLEQREKDYMRQPRSAIRPFGLVICEFEPPATAPVPVPVVVHSGARRALLQLEGTRTGGTGLCQVVVPQARASNLVIVHRVVAYRFDGDGPGEVIAVDSHCSGWGPSAGPPVPGVHVPPQARRLYLQDWIRDDRSMLSRQTSPGGGGPSAAAGHPEAGWTCPVWAGHLRSRSIT